MLFRSKGFTLVELLTVISLCALLLVFLFNGGLGVLKDYQNHLVIEKAYMDLHNLELFRRGHSRNSSFNALENAAFNDLLSESDGDNYFLEMINSLENNSYLFPEAVNPPQYSINQQVSTVHLLVEEQGNTQDVTLSYREKDPLLSLYILDALYQR